MSDGPLEKAWAEMAAEMAKAGKAPESIEYSQALFYAGASTVLGIVAQDDPVTGAHFFQALDRVAKDVKRYHRKFHAEHDMPSPKHGQPS